MKELEMGKNVNISEEKFEEILNKIYSVLKTLNFRKESCNFRKFEEDGLCKVINLQKNKWNTSNGLEFVINIGIYFTEDKKLINPKFKEYECMIRKRIENKGQWWEIDEETEVEAMFKDIEKHLNEILEWFNHFESKEATIQMILNGEADQYSDTEVFYYQTAKMLANMGYVETVYNRIKDIWSTTFMELANEIYENKKR